jgi:integrase
LFAETGRSRPCDLTESDVLGWCGRASANNSIRSRLSCVTVFLRWCVRKGLADAVLVETLRDRDCNPLLRIPRLYGKKQGKHPPRWLSRDEAFGQLLSTCDDSDHGLRDELVLRLGLAGARGDEIIHLQVQHLRLMQQPSTVEWIGKANRPRKIVVGDRLQRVLDEYLRRYATALGRPVTASDPLVCRQKPGVAVAGRRNVSWGNPFKQTCNLYRLVAGRAAAAGLGHVATHDLRRTAAGILHHTYSADGGHKFDLRDIQKTLDHANPQTTERSYLDPLDNDAKERAASVLD